MSSLTYNAIAARSGIGTATLERYWGSRVDAVTDALAEVFAAHPVPDTGDLRRDLRAYMLEIGHVLSEPRSRQSHRRPRRPRQRPTSRSPRHSANASANHADASSKPASAPTSRCSTVPIDTAIDQLVGPIYYRTVITDSAVDEHLVDAVLDAVLTPNDGTTPS